MQYPEIIAIQKNKNRRVKNRTKPIAALLFQTILTMLQALKRHLIEANISSLSLI